MTRIEELNRAVEAAKDNLEHLEHLRYRSEQDESDAQDRLTEAEKALEYALFGRGCSVADLLILQDRFNAITEFDPRWREKVVLQEAHGSPKGMIYRDPTIKELIDFFEE